MHAVVCGCYLESGAWNPVGGSSAFAEHLIPAITQAGGEARAGETVGSLLFKNDKVVGVASRLPTGCWETEDMTRIGSVRPL